MLSQEHIIAILYDLSQTISSEVKLTPLLKKLLQRLMYHTSYSCGFILKSETLSDGSEKQYLQISIGDRGLQKHLGEPLDISYVENKTLDLTKLPVRQDHYKSTLILTIPKYGKILLLAVEEEENRPPYEKIFTPILANLSKTITLCQYSEAYTDSLVKDKVRLTDDNLLFRQSLDTSSDFIILADSKSGTIIDFNKSTPIALGYNDNEMASIELENIFTEDTFPSFKKIAKRIKSNQQSTISEFSFKCKDGESFPVETRISLLKREDKPPVLITVASNITERKRHERELYSANKLSETTLNSIGDAVITTDAKGLINRMNSIAEGLTGWSFNDAEGQPVKNIFNIVNASTRMPIKNPVEKVLATGKTVFLSNHTTLIGKNGTEHQIADSAAPIQSSGSEILGMVLVFNDVTEQYKLRESLFKREQEQREILNSMIDGVITINEQNMVKTFNHSAEKMFCYSADELIGKDINILARKLDSKEDNSYIKDLITSGDVNNFSISRELVAIKKDKGTFPARLSIVELQKKEDEKKDYLVSFQDITYIKDQEEQLKRSMKMDALGNLTGGIAHDYNNMLGVILGFTELLKYELKDSPKLSRYIHNIHHAGLRGTSLTKKLLSFSRSRTSTPISLNINTMLEGEKHMLEKTLTARINLKLDLFEDLWPVLVDSSDLEDTILNMSINAMHSMKDNGQLTIKTNNKSISNQEADIIKIAAGNYVSLSLTDTGCGMDKDTMDKIFDPFYTTKGDQGTGLGLSQVYGFVDRSGGVIRVESEPGKGSTFTIYFPKHKQNGSEETKTDTGKTTAFTGTESILVVDDEPALLSLTTEVLSENGYSVISAKNSQEALEKLEDNQVDIVLSDVIMPGMNGFKLAHIIKEKYPKIKIQLASGFNNQENIDIVDKKLRDNILPKPYTIDELLKKIRNLLDE